MSDCIVWQGSRTAPDGYGQKRVGNKRRLVHQLAYEEAYGPIPEGMVVMHSCDNRPCYNPDHLSLGTPKDNIQDALSKGRMALGSRCGRSKLHEDLIPAIRSDTRSHRKIAADYGVDHQTIGAIKRGETWLHVT